MVRAEGFGALSIRRLGEELNAGATSIYGHVRDKGHLCDLVVDELVGAIQLPDRGRPERRLVKFAESARSVMAAHPGMAELLMQRGGTGPNAIRLAERVLAALVAVGVGESRLMDAYHSILAYVNGFTVASALSRTGDPDDLAARRADAQAHLAGADPAQIPTLRAALAHRPLDDDARFRFGMNAILAGLHDSRTRRGPTPLPTSREALPASDEVSIGVDPFPAGTPSQPRTLTCAAPATPHMGSTVHTRSSSR